MESEREMKTCEFSSTDNIFCFFFSDKFKIHSVSPMIIHMTANMKNLIRLYVDAWNRCCQYKFECVHTYTHLISFTICCCSLFYCDTRPTVSNVYTVFHIFFSLLAHSTPTLQFPKRNIASITFTRSQK